MEKNTKIAHNPATTRSNKTLECNCGSKNVANCTKTVDKQLDAKT